MAFPSGLYTDRPEKEGGNCRQQETAVQCWFTAKGTAMPLMMKIQDSDGEIRRIGPIQTESSEKIWMAGIPVWEYRCAADWKNREIRFRLRFYPENCIWKLVV